MDYIDEIIVGYMEGTFDLNDLEQAELDLVLARLEEVATEKLLNGFELPEGEIVHVHSVIAH